jgi:hypothetical protein
MPSLTHRLQILRHKAATALLARWQQLPADVRLAALVGCRPEELPAADTPWSEDDMAAWRRLAALTPPQPEHERHAALVEQFTAEGISLSWQAVFRRAGLLRQG